MKNISVFCLLTTVCAGSLFAEAKRVDMTQYFVSTNYLNCAALRVEKPTFKGGVLSATSGQTVDFAKPCARGLTFGEGFTNLAARVAAMDAASIDTALLSSFVQVWDLPEADAIRVARESNNDIAQMMKAHPGRFEGAALLPIVAGSETCVEAALAELERCVNELGFKVWIAASNFGADHLYDAKFEPLLARAEELGVAILLKAAYPIEEPFAALDGADDPNEWGLALNEGQDVMVTATRLAMNGSFDRYPKLRVILPNLGEYLPFNLDRMSHMLSNFEDSKNAPCQKTLFYYVVTNQNYILTTSSVTNEIPFVCAKGVMSADRICFGSGWPFDDMQAQADAIATFDLTDKERAGVLSLNALTYALPRTTDYATDDGKDWLFNHAIAGKECPDEAKTESNVDLFYVYPTLVGNEQIVIDGFRGIDDEAMRAPETNLMTAVGSYCNTARCFAEMTHVYAPFYRQATLDTATDCATNAAGEVVADGNAKYLAKLCEGPAYSDVTNALSVYFAKWNNGRKLVFAAHSQGSAILRLVMENYFTLPENQDKAKQIICSYQIGYGIGQSSVDAITAATGVTFAERADDTNVIVSYNSMGEGTSGNSVLLMPDTLAINPITWTRSTDLAEKDLNLGALTSAVGMPDVIEPGLYSAQVVDTGVNRGHVNVCKELNDQVLAPCLFGVGSLHASDYGAYWENLRANIYDRGGKLAGFAKLSTTNFPSHLCVSNMMFSTKDQKTYTTDSVGETVWIPTNAEAAVVFLVAEKGYRLIMEGEEVASAPIPTQFMTLDQNGEYLIKADVMNVVKVEWVQRAPDYADETGKDWLFHHDINEKRYAGEPAEDPGVDLFYFYPTSVIVSDDHVVDGVCDIEDTVLRGPSGAINSWNLTAKVFGDITHVYAPYYRQTPSDVEMPIGEQPEANASMRKYWYEHAPYQDVTNALTHYFTKINPDGKRPFIFAGHSHGSGMLSLVMEHFFTESSTRKAWLKNMVACYALGWGVSKDWEKDLNDKLEISVATNATDAGVYVFWNVYGPNANTIETILYPDPEKSAAAVNPILWTRVATNATANLNLGGFTADNSAAVKPGLYDASNHVANGTIICTSKDLESQYLAPPRRMFGEHSLHLWDYMLYWENIHANALQRIKTLKAKLGEPDCTQIPLVGTPIAYNDPYNWVMNTGSTKPLDVFYVYPTAMMEGDSTIVPVTDMMKEKVYNNSYVGAASAFASYANVFIPAYRQMNMAAVTAAQALYTEPRDFIDCLKGQTPRTDLFAALDYYFTNVNVSANRPFILAGHSQGTCMLKQAFEDYFRSNAKRKGYLQQMVATYGLGYSFAPDWFDTYYPD